MTPRTPDDDLRVALIGFGLAGATFHAPFIATTPGLHVAAVVTRDAERQERARHDHPGAAVVDTVERLWEMAAALDVVVVASPNATHAPLATDALRAGLHVVVDKPFARSAAEGRALADEARRRGRLVVPFHNRRWDGDLLTVRRLLADDALGHVSRFESRFERWRAAPKPRWTAADARANAEGVLFDLGTHLVDQALLLFGPVTHVYAELDRRDPAHTVEDDAFVALTHASGVRSHLHASTAAAVSGPRLTVLGSLAGYVKHGVDVQEAMLRAGARPDRSGWGEEPSERWGVLTVGGVEGRAVRTEPGDYGRFYAALVDAIRDGTPPPVTPEEAVAGLEVIEEAKRVAVSATR
ncbi:MAG TPA: Gfo/Idh/MocA family oxidoreductase [Gemmatimonadaceae bacterium]|nr:Gfo/Idh/MocA family oxidoreductase [Gemmatimonadaceae bacterium]